MTKSPDPMRSWRIAAIVFAILGAIAGLTPPADATRAVIGAVMYYAIVIGIGKAVTYFRNRNR